MVVYSPKKRRTDETPPTAQQIADTNATLRAVFGIKHNRFLHMRQEEGATGTPGSNALREDIRAGDVATRPGTYTRSPNAQATRPPSLNVDTTAGQPSGASPDLVNYELPYTAQEHTPMTAAIAPHPWPRSASASNPGLPSPAPSEAPSEKHAGPPGNGVPMLNESGARARFVPEKRPRGRPRKYPLNASVANTAHVRSPNAGSPASAASHTPSQLPTNVRVPTPSSSLAPANLRANSIAHASNAALSPQQGTQPIVPSNDKGLFSVFRMQQRLDEFFGPRAQILNSIDHGRRALVQEAIEKEDFFYLTLSQTFCLHTCARQYLPKQLERIQAASWSFLEQLLCSNQAMSPLVVQWFSEFPAPIHIISATTGESQFFMNQLVVVESFLHELPRRWAQMIEVSERRLAPPLTQEMVEELYLISPVVQTTVFRAISRSFWGDDNSALRYLESLHKIDQHTYTFQQWRRDVVEKQIATSIFAQVYHAWKQQCKNVQQGADEQDFVPPPACEYFKKLPPSMVSRLPAHHGHGQVSRNQAQQLQLIEMNHRILAQHQAVPGLTSEQQRILLQTNNQTMTQQGLLPHALQRPQYQPVQPLQLQTNLNQNQMIPHTNGIAPLHHPNLLHPSMQQESALRNPHLRRLIPPENASPRPLPVQPDTTRASLHQAHLRSPIPGNKQLPVGEQSLYRHVTGYALPPVQLNRTICSQTVTVTMTEEDLKLVPTTMPSSLPGEPSIRTLREGSVLYRLRFSIIPPAKGFDSEASWVTAENLIPEHFVFEVNGTYLEMRRKLHHGRCLPIDVTSLLRAGSNTLNVYNMPNPADISAYAVAIERIGVSSHASIVSSITCISAEDSLAAIKDSLASPQDDDDDFALVSSTLNIPLFDPFRADRICEDPVRGSACLHRECFDLETFLSQCKREEPGYPCVPDCWRCPICKGDVRPQTLVRDGFLVQVKEQMAAKSLLNTRAIVVEADGSWKPKVEAQSTGVRSKSLEVEEAAASAMAADANSNATAVGSGKGKAKIVEVIELD